MGDRRKYLGPNWNKVDSADSELARKDLPSLRAHSRTYRARRGQISASREILEEFVGVVDKCDGKSWSGPIHWFDARFLADAFSRLLEGEDPAISLGVKTSDPGRRPGQTTHDESAMAAAYCFLRRRGIKAERANGLLGERTGANRRYIQKAVAANQRFKDPDLFSDDDLKVFLDPYAAIIESILAADAE